MENPEINPLSNRQLNVYKGVQNQTLKKTSLLTNSAGEMGVCILYAHRRLTACFEDFVVLEDLMSGRF